MKHSYEYARPALTVDAVVFGLDGEGLKVLLIERGLPPFKGAHALPGGFVRVGEDLESAVRRELQEETGLKDLYLEQLMTFGAPKRDPREHIVSVAYYALVNIQSHQAQAATDAAAVAWHPLSDVPDLAFDHTEILGVARERLKGKVRYRPIGFELLPERFTLSQLQHLYETVIESQLDKRNFRKKVLSLDLLVDTEEREENVAYRPAKLYRFDRKKYAQLTKRGFEFSI